MLERARPPARGSRVRRAPRRSPGPRRKPAPSRCLRFRHRSPARTARRAVRRSSARAAAPCRPGPANAARARRRVALPDTRAPGRRAATGRTRRRATASYVSTYDPEMSRDSSFTSRSSSTSATAHPNALLASFPLRRRTYAVCRSAWCCNTTAIGLGMTSAESDAGGTASLSEHNDAGMSANERNRPEIVLTESFAGNLAHPSRRGGRLGTGRTG